MRPSEGSLLSATGLVRRFGAARALDGVDLSLGAGETFVLAGPNGAGKTTLLRVLAGLTRPTAGTVMVRGRRVQAGDAESRRPIGLVSHHSLLYDDLPLVENLVFAARLYGLEDPAGRAAAALASAGLAARAQASPRALSRGLLQRAAIARALLHQPALLLLDEPFTGLDAEAAAGLRRSLERHAEAGGSAVVVTHHVSEAWPLATHVGVLRAGAWALREPRTGTLDEFLARADGLAHG